MWSTCLLLPGPMPQLPVCPRRPGALCTPPGAASICPATGSGGLVALPRSCCLSPPSVLGEARGRCGCPTACVFLFSVLGSHRPCVQCCLTLPAPAWEHVFGPPSPHPGQHLLSLLWVATHSRKGRRAAARAGVVQTCTFPAPGSSAPTCMPHTASWLAAAPTVSARLPAPSGCRAGTWDPGGGWSAEGQPTGTRHCLCSLCRWSCQAVVPACLGLTFVFCPQLALKIVNKYADWALGPSLGPVAGPVEMGGRVPGPVLWWWGCWPALCRVVMPRAEQAPRA